MIELNELIPKYSQLIDGNKNLLYELEWLKEKSEEKCEENNKDWIRLSDNEKKIKRILLLKAMRKTEGYNNGIFELEERVIDLYETIGNLLMTLNDDSSEFLIIRLKVFLLLVKRIINCNRDIRKVNDFYLKELQSVITDCVNSNLESYFIETINISYLEFKLYKIQQVLNSNK